MIIYAGKDYQDVSRKAANIMSWTGYRFHACGHVCTTGRMVQKRGSGFFQGDKCESG